MNRKLPLCAWCGKPLARAKCARVVEEYGDLPGRPLIGWHAGPRNGQTCWYDETGYVDGRDMEEMLSEISERGPGRVNRGPIKVRAVRHG